MTDTALIADYQDYQYYICDHVDKIFATVRDIFCKYEDLLPASRQAKILIKLNLNSNMNALTGNTTDLRLVAAVLSELNGRGYENIIVGRERVVDFIVIKLMLPRD